MEGRGDGRGNNGNPGYDELKSMVENLLLLVQTLARQQRVAARVVVPEGQFKLYYNHLYQPEGGSDDEKHTVLENPLDAPEGVSEEDARTIVAGNLFQRHVHVETPFSTSESEEVVVDWDLPPIYDTYPNDEDEVLLQSDCMDADVDGVDASTDVGEDTIIVVEDTSTVSNPINLSRSLNINQDLFMVNDLKWIYKQEEVCCNDTCGENYLSRIRGRILSNTGREAIAAMLSLKLGSIMCSAYPDVDIHIEETFVRWSTPEGIGCSVECLSTLVQQVIVNPESFSKSLANVRFYVDTGQPKSLMTKSFTRFKDLGAALIERIIDTVQNNYSSGAVESLKEGILLHFVGDSKQLGSQGVVLPFDSRPSMSDDLEIGEKVRHKAEKVSSYEEGYGGHLCVSSVDWLRENHTKNVDGLRENHIKNGYSNDSEEGIIVGRWILSCKHYIMQGKRPFIDQDSEREQIDQATQKNALGIVTNSFCDAFNWIIEVICPVFLLNDWDLMEVLVLEISLLKIKSELSHITSSCFLWQVAILMQSGKEMERDNRVVVRQKIDSVPLTVIQQSGETSEFYVDDKRYIGREVCTTSNKKKSVVRELTANGEAHLSQGKESEVDADDISCIHREVCATISKKEMVAFVFDRGRPEQKMQVTNLALARKYTDCENYVIKIAMEAYCLYRQNKLDEVMECLSILERIYSTRQLESRILYRLGKMENCVDLYQQLQNLKINSLEINSVADLVSAGIAYEVQGTMNSFKVKPVSSFELAYDDTYSLIERQKYVEAKQQLLSARRTGQETVMANNWAELASIAIHLAYVRQLLVVAINNLRRLKNILTNMLHISQWLGKNVKLVVLDAPTNQFSGRYTMVANTSRRHNGFKEKRRIWLLAWQGVMASSGLKLVCSDYKDGAMEMMLVTESKSNISNKDTDLGFVFDRGKAVRISYGGLFIVFRKVMGFVFDRGKTTGCSHRLGKTDAGRSEKMFSSGDEFSFNLG